jgi:hypothetical protein
MLAGHYDAESEELNRQVKKFWLVLKLAWLIPCSVVEALLLTPESTGARLPITENLV